MGKFFDHATAQCTLKAAWGRIPRTAPTPRPKKRVRRLPTSTRPLNIRRIQAKLRRGEFQFDPQQGVLKQKAGGNGKRGIVMASVQNRIVERALLDSLQAKSPFIQQVLEVPTSVGGVPHRSVPHGLRVIEEAFKEASSGSPAPILLASLTVSRATPFSRRSPSTSMMRRFLIFSLAPRPSFSLERALGDDRRCFPTDKDGVAQGSPLSPLFGNILLHDFDRRLNGPGIVTPRFIDDFAIFGHSESAVAKAFATARACLDELGLKCHDPFADGDRTKSAHENASIGFDFLGYRIEPGLFQPS